MPAPSLVAPVSQEARTLRRQVAANLQQGVAQKGLTIPRLAAHAGIRSHVLRALLQGERSATLAVISRLAAALGTTAADLLAAPADAA